MNVSVDVLFNVPIRPVRFSSKPYGCTLFKISSHEILLFSHPTIRKQVDEKFIPHLKYNTIWCYFMAVLTDTGEDSKVVHRRKRRYFLLFFPDASESKLLASTFGNFRLYRLRRHTVIKRNINDIIISISIWDCQIRTNFIYEPMRQVNFWNLLRR